MFYNELLKGKAITIEPDGPQTVSYTPALFWIDNGILFVRSPETGSTVLNRDAESMNAHFETMQTLGFAVSVMKRETALKCYNGSADGYRAAWY